MSVTEIFISRPAVGKTHGYTFPIEPYCVKLFENRWYVLARNNRDEMRVYGLDRIEDCVICEIAIFSKHSEIVVRGIVKFVIWACNISNNSSNHCQSFLYSSYISENDTICTIAVADAILNDNDYKTSMRKWCRKYPHPKGEYGSFFLNWVMRPDPYPYNSFGNGSAYIEESFWG